MCPPEDIPLVARTIRLRLGFNGFIIKKPDEPADVVYRLLDRFLSQDVGLQILGVASSRRRFSVPRRPLAVQGQRISILLNCQDFREEVRVHHTANHLSTKAVFDGMSFEKAHREAS